MRQKRFIIFFLGIFFLAFAGRAEVLKVYRAESGVGWLERSEQGDLILHLEGSWYDMGYEQGKLLKKECLITLNSVKGLLRSYLPFASFKLTKKLLYKTVYKREEPYIPEEFKQELKGLADALEIRVEDLQALHAMIFIASCSGASAFGRATKDGELYQTRSLDYPLTFIDPKTKTPLQNQSLIVVYKPKGAIPFISFSWPGFIGSVGGMNVKGICVSEMTDASWYERPAGLPMIFRIKQTLAKAKTLDQAIKLMTQKPLEGGYNFLVGDGKIPSAVAIEMNAKRAYVGSWNSPAESNSYWNWFKKYEYHPLEGLIVRTNHPLSKEIIKYYPIPIWLGRNSTGWRYFDLRKRLEREYGNLDMVRMMEIMRQHYQGMCSPPDYKGCSPTMYQAVFAPAKGDFLIAFAHGNPRKQGTYKTSAYNQPYHRYNIFGLIKAKPESKN